ncbi:tol-pal system protein YbgF [Ectothiorhodospiraceae bacterium 2226]|nr:tol-pal system protein YbgF [Ectothiorhodospiraceae bacterium 2226]
MRLSRRVLSVGLAGMLAAGAPAVWAQDDRTDARLERIERLLESRGLAEMLLQVEALQREVQELRGELEQQTHTLEQLRQRQRDLYLDTDRRLLQLERGQPESGAFAPVPVPGDEHAAASAEEGAQAPPQSGEQEAYQAAFDLLRELRYEQAVQAFTTFLDSYPQGRHAHMAQYWIAEAHYAQRRFPQAIEHYRALLENHPRSPKVPEALLKIGYSYHELGESAEARQVVQTLLQRHPDTTEAGQARTLLEALR